MLIKLTLDSEEALLVIIRLTAINMISAQHSSNNGKN